MRKLFIFAIAAFMSLSAVAQTGSAPVPAETAKDTDNNLIKAALKGWHLHLGAGFNIGGAAPLPLPREIRSIESYNPMLNIALEGDVHKKINRSSWGVMLGLRLETKAMKTDAVVKNYHMEAVSADGAVKINGAWTGHVRTRVDNTYLTFPMLATYTISDRWQVQAGPYLSWMMNGSFSGEAYDGYIRDIDPTGEKAEVSSATYDFSKDLRHFHWGLQLGGEFKAYRHLAVTANLQWGLNGIFPSDFESVTFSLYPIYATVGFSYLF